MCLAIPGEIVEIHERAETGEPAETGESAGDALRTGQVSFAGVVKQVCLAYVPEAQIGDFVLVHAGFAIAQVSEQHARETLACLAQLGEDEP